MQVKLVFDHPKFLVADKPGGCLTVPSRYEKNDQRKVLGRELERITSARLFPVHRLEYEVSGLVVFAKDAETHKKISHLFESREVEKTYEAWTGTQDFAHWPKELPFVNEVIELNPEKVLNWKCKLLRGKRRSYESPQGQESITFVSFVGKTKSGGLKWHVKPETGRPHQIRFEMSRHGLPILGDILYGSRKNWKPEQIALRAVRLRTGKMFSDALDEFVVEGIER